MHNFPTYSANPQIYDRFIQNYKHFYINVMYFFNNTLDVRLYSPRKTIFVYLPKVPTSYSTHFL